MERDLQQQNGRRHQPVYLEEGLSGARCGHKLTFALVDVLHARYGLIHVTFAACTQDEVNAVFDAAKKVHRSWARTPLWKRAEYLHKVDALLKDNVEPMANALVKEIAKPAKDAKTEVVRSGDLIAYTAEEGVRFLGQGKLLNSDSFPGQERSKLCLCQKVSNAFDWLSCSVARLGSLADICMVHAMAHTCYICTLHAETCMYQNRLT